MESLFCMRVARILYNGRKNKESGERKRIRKTKRNCVREVFTVFVYTKLTHIHTHSNTLTFSIHAYLSSHILLDTSI